MRKIFFNAKVYTGETKLQDAFVVEDNKFIYAGNLSEAENFIDENTEKIDLQGNFICAGFNDSHMHLLNYGYALSMAGLSEHTNSLSEMLSYLKQFAQENNIKEGSWLRGRGWNHDYFVDEKRFPNRYDLDKVSTDYPICITRTCGHCCVVNSKALEVLGIDENTPQIEGGHFDVDENGKPTGVFRENAMDYVYSKMPQPSLAEIKAMMEKAIKALNSYGVTSSQTDDFIVFQLPYQTIIKAYKELEAEGKLTVRVNEQSHFTNTKDLQQFFDEGYNTNVGTEFFKIGPLKMLGDGSLGSRTAFLSHPYNDDKSTRGIAIFTQEQFDEMVMLAHEHNMQIAIHAIGDGILDRILNAYKKALFKLPKENHRHGIVHCQITRPEQLEDFAKLNLHVYAQPIFLDYDIHIVHERVGEKLASTSYAFNTLQKKGVHVSSGTDCPVEAPNVMNCIQCAVTRTDLKDDCDVYLEHEAMSVKEAIDSYTIEGAYASFEENKKGKIQKGMLADFVVLNENPFEIEKTKIKNIKVLQTYVDGKLVYNA